METLGPEPPPRQAEFVLMLVCRSFGIMLFLLIYVWMFGFRIFAFLCFLEHIGHVWKLLEIVRQILENVGYVLEYFGNVLAIV